MNVTTRPGSIDVRHTLLMPVLAVAVGLIATTARAEHIDKLKQTELAGTITAVDADGNTITVKAADGQSTTLGVIEETRIMVGGKAGALLDVKADSKATIKWVELPQDKKKVAAVIEIP